MTTQLPLQLARLTDPRTSHDAAERTVSFRAKHEAAIYAAICEMGERGATMHEIAWLTGLEPVQIGRRLSTMRDRHLIERHYQPGVCPQQLIQRNRCCVWFRK